MGVENTFFVKEVIQPQVPLRLPCYDFTPVMKHTVVNALPKVRLSTSGAIHFHGVTGGVYKAREHIHRRIHDQRLLAIPSSSSRVAEMNSNYDKISWLAPIYKFAANYFSHCSTCAAQNIRGMRTWRHPYLPPNCNRWWFLAFLNNKKKGLRSLRDLTQDLKTRADDSHAPPVK